MVGALLHLFLLTHSPVPVVPKWTPNVVYIKAEKRKCLLPILTKN